jgi:hypothetical protein
MALNEALERAVRVYEAERRHAAPVDAVAQHMGYKNANSGTALQAIASLRYYGLLERPEDGKLAVSKDVEAYQFAPSEELKRELQLKWLRAPPIFAELLTKYAQALPSDATMRYELIQRGFSPATAESVLSVFRQSVEFTRYFELVSSSIARLPDDPFVPSQSEEDLRVKMDRESALTSRAMPDAALGNEHDRIPVRLPGGRRAWLEIPTPFFESDKKRLKDQIDLLLTDEERVDATMRGTP